MSARRPDGREIVQKAKAKRRPKHWHQGHELVELPEVGSGADPTSGEPTPCREADRRHRRGGDAV
jgi:hypothetical protein